MISSRTFATQTTERLIARIYSAACALSATETLVNAWSQRAYLSTLSMLGIMGFAFVIGGMLVAAWTKVDMKLWYRLHGITAIVLLTEWPTQVASTWPHELHPWIWWALGNAAISAGIGFAGWIGVALQILIPTGWVFLATSPIAGSAKLQNTLADAAYVLLLSATISSMIWALRTRAKLVDSSNLKTALASAEKNRLDALERESSSAAALVHTLVVGALDEAIEAKTQQQKQVAKQSAENAVAAIDDRLKFADLDSEASPLLAWTQNIRETISTRYPQVAIETTNIDGVHIPNEISLALTESTLQAVDNSVRHAGPRANTRLKIEGLQAGVKVLVVDNGRGFRVSRDSRGQLGIRRSIFDRCKTAGIKANVDSSPGSGCRIKLIWVQA